MAFNIGPLRGGKFSPVATLTFDAKHKGTLGLIQASDEADDLDAAWKKIAKQPVVSYKGHEGRARVKKSARKGDPGYPRAAAEARSQQTGQFASPL